MSYLKYNKLEVSIGNLKIGNDTLIFNMGSATDCPALKLGFCKLGKKCYAYKAERLYPEAKPYRDRQAKYWLNTGAHDIALDIFGLLNKYKKAASRIKYIRLNESGDFYSQECIEKLDTIVDILSGSKFKHITFYTYTARKDLNFKKAKFLVKGSSNNVGNNGKSIARPKSELDEQGTFEHGMFYYKEEHFALCAGDCRECSLCKCKNGANIVFAIH